MGLFATLGEEGWEIPEMQKDNLRLQAEADAEFARLRAEIARLRKGIQEYLDNGYGCGCTSCKYFRTLLSGAAKEMK